MAGSSHGYAWPWRIPRDGHVVGDLLGQRREARPNVGPFDVIASGAGVPVCLGRSGGRLAGHGWLGQSLHQGPDLGVGVASVTAQGTEIRQPALLGPATHRLWGHVEELGDLCCTEVPRLGWLGHRPLHSCRVSPRWGTTLRSSETNAIERSTHSEPAAGSRARSAGH